MFLTIVVLRAEVFLEAAGCIGFFYQTLLAADWVSAQQHGNAALAVLTTAAMPGSENEEAETQVYLPTELTSSLILGTSNALYFGQ